METQCFACKGGTGVTELRVDMKFVYKVILLLLINIKGETSGRRSAGRGETPHRSRSVRSVSKQTSRIADV